MHVMLHAPHSHVDARCYDYASCLDHAKVLPVQVYPGSTQQCCTRQEHSKFEMQHWLGIKEQNRGQHAHLRVVLVAL